MVFTAIAYDNLAIIPSFDEAKKLRSLIVTSTAESAAGSESAMDWPNGAAVANQIRGYMSTRLCRIKRFQVCAEQLAKPIFMDVWVMKGTGAQQYIAQSDRAILVDNDSVEISFGDTVHAFNWEAYSGGIDSCLLAIATSSLTVNDYFRFFLELEVVE